MKRSVFWIAVIGLLVLLLGACAQGDGNNTLEATDTFVEATPLPPAAGGSGDGGEAEVCEESGLAEQDLVASGETVYASQCAGCHGAQGEGAGEFPALAGNDIVQSENPEEAIAVLTNLAVHPFAGTISDQDAAAALTYVRNSFGNNASLVCPADLGGVSMTR